MNDQASRSTESAPVSVVIPALNEARTVGDLIRLMGDCHLVREVLVVDDGSIDGTPEVAAGAGARVLTSTLLGKGASMEDGVKAAVGEVLLFLDGDLLELPGDLVDRVCGPIISGDADLVKAKFTRDAGRVTVLTARPLLESFFPEAARFEQPLSGIVAARRSLLTEMRLESDYGVDVGLLIDTVMKGARVIEVDIGRIDHESQSLAALGQMAKQITRVILDRAWKHQRLGINQVLEMQEAERRARAEWLPGADGIGACEKVALLDMDGVLVEGRYVVELAERVGVQSELAMFLDNRFLPSDQRASAIASLFTGVHWDVFEEIALSMPLMAGAVETVVALRAAGYRVGIVTDSFHVAAETVRRRVFADFCVANVMHFEKRLATGQIKPSPLTRLSGGCSEHEHCKSNVVHHLRRAASPSLQYVVAVGDGENDVCMLRSADLSVAFNPKSSLVEEAAVYTVRDSLQGVLDLLPPVDASPTPAVDALSMRPAEF